MFTSKGRCTEPGCGRVGSWSETFSCYLCDSCHGARAEVAKFAQVPAALPAPTPAPVCIECGDGGTIHSKTFDAPVCLACLDNMILGRVLTNDPRVFIGLRRLEQAISEVLSDTDGSRIPAPVDDMVDDLAEAIRLEGVALPEVSDGGDGAVDSDRDIYGARAL